VPGRVVERAAAGDQPQARVPACRVDQARRVRGLGVHPHAGHPEVRRHTVGEPDADPVAGHQRPEPEEHRWPRVPVHVPDDDRRPQLAGCRRVLVPRGELVAGRQVGDRHRATGAITKPQQRRIDTDRGYRDRHRHRTTQLERPRPAGRPGRGRRRARRVHLGQEDHHDRDHPETGQRHPRQGQEPRPETTAGAPWRLRVSIGRPRQHDSHADDTPPLRLSHFCGLSARILLASTYYPGFRERG
jgi:hypothetical protein